MARTLSDAANTPVVVIAPASFNRLLSAQDVTDAIASGIQRARPDAHAAIVHADVIITSPCLMANRCENQ
jgi:long-subunit fatty acid transport protein